MPFTAAATVDPIAPTRANSGVRAEIQALRALAVLGVLLFHLWPLRLPGGYVGVDVFFVVSGFLITDHLLREHQRTDRVSLPRFWARRARRLLPASLLVLVVTAFAVWLWVPEARWAQFGREIIASALYVENWALAAQSVDYMALSNVKSPVQHFWSLGVEEQFYLVWPLLIIAGYAIARLARRSTNAAIATVLAVAVIASLAYSVSLTATDPSVAYFSTFTRAWEFGLGALLSLALRRAPQPFRGGWASAASWAGFGMIAAAMLLFTEATPFPSYTASLPVIGTLLVISAGSPRAVGAPTPLFSLRPLQLIGDVSYGTYLWHWPLIVLLPYALKAPLTTVSAIAILLASILLGWLSKRFIEDPLRTRPIIAGTRPRWTFAGVLVVMGIVVGAAMPLATHTIAPPKSPSVADQPDCYGAAAMVDSACGPAEEVALEASPASFTIDLPPEDIRACERSTNSGAYQRCDFGPVPATGPHVALIGDSHSTRLVEPLRTAIEEEGGTLSTFLVSGCAVMSHELTGSAWGYEQVYAEQCRDLTTQMQDEIAADPDIDLVVLNNRTRLYVSGEQAFHPLTEEAVANSIDRLRNVGKQVVVIKDPPEMSAIPPQQGESAADCLERVSSPQECSLPRSQAVFADPMAAAAETAGAGLIDLDVYFCNADRCMSQIGGLVVYSDDNHLTRSFALSLAGPLGDALAPYLSPLERSPQIAGADTEFGRWRAQPTRDNGHLPVWRRAITH